MSKVETLDGATADLSDLSVEQLREMVLAQRAEQQAARDRAQRLGDITLEYKEGVMSRQDKATGEDKQIPWNNVSIAGGVFGWRGIKLKPEQWAKLCEIKEEVDAVMRASYPEMSGLFPSK